VDLINLKNTVKLASRRTESTNQQQVMMDDLNISFLEDSVESLAELPKPLGDWSFTEDDRELLDLRDRRSSLLHEVRTLEKRRTTLMDDVNRTGRTVEQNRASMISPMELSSCHTSRKSIARSLVGPSRLFDMEGSCNFEDSRSEGTEKLKCETNCTLRGLLRPYETRIEELEEKCRLREESSGTIEKYLREREYELVEKNQNLEKLLEKANKEYNELQIKHEKTKKSFLSYMARLEHMIVLREPPKRRNCGSTPKSNLRL